MADTTNIWYLGETINCNVALTDPDTGEAIDLDAITDIVVEVYHQTSGKSLQRFRKVTTEGFDGIVIDDPTYGEFTFSIDHANTEDAAEGVYAIEIKYWNGEDPVIEKGLLGRLVKAKTTKTE